MLIADQNKKGGLLGRKLEPIVVDPASDWDALCGKGAGTAHEGKGRGRVRLLDFRLPQIRSADLRAAERPALLPCAIRGRRELAQHFLHGSRAQSAGNSGGSISDEQGRRRSSQMGSAWHRLRLSAHDQPDLERVSHRRGRIARRHYDDLYAVRLFRMARDRRADQGLRFGGKKDRGHINH